MEERWTFQQMAQLDRYKQKMSLTTNFSPYTKIHSKWTIGLKVKCKIMVIKTGENL